MPASAPPRTRSVTGSVRRLVGPLVLTAFACVGASTSQAPRLVHAESPPGSGVESPRSPKTWVRASESSQLSWWIWSEVHDYLGEAEWKSIGVTWMPARARTDIEAVGTKSIHRYGDQYMLAGLWRLDLEREAVLKLLSARDGDAVWPLTTRDHLYARGSAFPILWRPRLERWYRAQPAGERADRLRAKLAESWRAAMESKDVGLAAAVVEAMDERLGRESGDARASEALGLVREAILAVASRIRADPRETFVARVPTSLMERFGVPEQVDLRPILAGARRGEESLRGEPIPYPHPYDHYLLILRLQRLLDQHR